METENDVPNLEEGITDWTGTYTWRVKNWTQITEESIYSPEFEVGGYSWRLLVFPRGNEAHGSVDHISIYLAFPEASFTPPQMCPKAKFELMAMRRSSPDDSPKPEATHAFTAQAADWGFTEFIPIEQVENPEHGYLVDDTLTLRATISIQRDDDLDATPTPTRDMTFIGLKKQGDGGYINCLLQCLFHIGSFRKAIYQMPGPGQEASAKSVLRIVQSIFYQLQYQDSFVDASSLKEAMGWNSNDTVFQHDLQKMHSTLLGTLDHRTRDHEAQSVASSAFKGRVFQCIKCLSVQYASTWKQAYTEIQLDVLGCKDIYESLEKLCRFERLDRTNKKDTAIRGLIDTKQGALFESFPSVLQFHLKRSFYDPDGNVMLKINSHHAFYDVLDLDFNPRPFLSKNTDKTVVNKYKLHSVICHRGGPNGGHYSAFIRPNEKWYKFDNEDVEEVSAEDAINKQFGDDDSGIMETFSQDEGESAYSMACTLLYIRQSDWKRIMCEAGKEDIPKLIRRRLEAGAIDEEVRDEREAHLYVVIKLACEQHFSEQLGKSYYFDLANFNDVKKYRIHKKTSFEDFKEMVKQDFEIPKHLQRFWLWDPRTNHTMRVSKPLIEGGVDLRTVLDLRHFRDKNSSPYQEKTALMTIKLFLESPEKAAVNEDTLRPIQKNELFIFLKYYNPELQTLSYLGHMFIEKICSFRAILEQAKKMAGLAHEEEVIGFEEVKHLPTFICTELDPEMTPQETQLIQGDIIIIQKVAADIQCEYPTVKSFLEFIQNSTKVTFRPLKNAEDEGFKLELLKTMSYDQVTSELAKRLQIDDPKKLRLTQHNVYTCMPHRSPIKYNAIESLERMILHARQYTYTLYYEVLDMQLPYLETLKCFTIGFHNSKGAWQSEHQLKLPKDERVSDLVKALKAELSEEYNDCDMRIMELLSSKVLKVLDPESVLEELQESSVIYRAEVIPEDQRNLRSDEYLVLFCHCKWDGNSLTVFGDPLWVKVKTGETVKEVKARVQKTLEISNEEFSQLRFAYHARPMHPVEYLSDKDEILAKLSGIALRGGTHGKFVGDNTSFIALLRDDKRLRRRTPSSRSLLTQ